MSSIQRATSDQTCMNGASQNPLSLEQEKQNLEFLSELKSVYNEIDKVSNLMWSHKDEVQLIQRRDNKQKTRSRITTEARQEVNKWEKETEAQLGYGEITKGALMNLISVLQKCTTLFNDDLRKKLPFPLEEYNLNSNSTFLDIGSGFGKPVFHASMQTYCMSKGIEVVPARVAFCVDQRFQILENQQKKKPIKVIKELTSSLPIEDQPLPHIEQISQEQEEQSAIIEAPQVIVSTQEVVRHHDSTFSSSLASNHYEPSIIPVGDVLSLLTGSLASVRSLQVSLPLLKEQQILSYEPSVLPSLDLLRKLIDDKLDNFSFQRSILVEPCTLSKGLQGQAIKESGEECKVPSNNKRDKKHQAKKSEALHKVAAQQQMTQQSQQLPESQNDSSKKKRTGIENLKADYRKDWCDRVDFQVCDAAKGPEKYQDENNQDYTHIYSYNKVMSFNDRKGISKILNKTNYRLLAWYFGPDKTKQCGLKNFALIYQSPMQSTGGEKFTCYVYYRTKKYEEGDILSDSSDEEENGEGEQEEGAHEEEIAENSDQQSSSGKASLEEKAEKKGQEKKGGKAKEVQKLQKKTSSKKK